jgi:hypothetical protein
MRPALALLCASVPLGAAVLAVAAAATTAPREAHTAGGTALAQASLLKLDDFGSGWKATQPTSASSPGLDFSCVGFAPKQRDIFEIGTATSPSFRGSEIGPFVQQKTSVYDTAKAAKTLWLRAVKPRLITCVAQTLGALESQSVHVTVTSTGTIKIGPMADRSASYRVVATLTTPKQRLKTYFDVVLLASKRTITELTISQFQKAPPLKLEQALARAVARRIGAGGPAA